MTILSRVDGIFQREIRDTGAQGRKDRYQTLEEDDSGVVGIGPRGSMPYSPVVSNHICYEELLLVS